ncbi:MAG: nicotinate (nicotinamide) nucleotide adenylyltransferase, partial [Selenomonadaceae bacterium]|nr:nicotinate (nicotinamide) nucleotide adenylyltransferase [Selenomonadaceae bacterium]
MKIAVYGGSFNPPHRGHVEAAHSVYKQLLPDKLLIIPTNIPPHKQLEANSPSPSERLALCRLAFEEVPKAEISDLEIRRKGKSFTFETVEILRKKNPGAEICIVVGTDMFLSFRTWFRWEDILRTCTLAVLSRETDDREKIISFQETLERE